MLLNIENLNISYSGIPTVKNINMTVGSGEIVGIAGESGCGKSTLLRSIMMLLKMEAKIESGNIIFNGKDLTNSSKEELRNLRGKDIAMIFQNAALAMDPIKTIGRHFYEIAVAHQEKISKDECNKRALKLMDNLRLKDSEGILKSYPFQISGGMNQRIAIAMAMFNSPSLMLADEPTSALDVTAQAQVVKMLFHLREEFKTAMIVVSHNIGVIAQLADKVGIMYAGRIVEWGNAEEVLTFPSHPYTKALIESIPNMNGIIPKGIIGSFKDSTIVERKCDFEPRCTCSFDRCNLVDPKKQWISSTHWVLCNGKVEGGDKYVTA